MDVGDYDYVKKIQEGCGQSFTPLVRKYEKLLLRLVARYIKDQEMAKDVVQEAFFKTYQSLPTFEFRCSFKNWLYKIALNTARNKIRSLKEMDNIDDVTLIEACTIELGMMQEEVLRTVRDLVDQLPEKQRQTLELRVFQDMSFKEVAAAMKCPYDTAKANYRHAMLKLKEHFDAVDVV